MDDRVHRGRGVQELVARGLELADDRGAQEVPAPATCTRRNRSSSIAKPTVGTTA